MSLGINLGAQTLGPDSWNYVSPICVGQIPEYIFHPYSYVIFLNIFFTHIRELNHGVSLPNLLWIYRESLVNVSWTCPRCQQLFSVWRIKSMKIMKFGLKWVHMARYELILRLDRALWLTIIFKPLPIPKNRRFAEKEVRRFRFEPPDRSLLCWTSRPH